MSQFSRIASAASSLTSRRHYTSRIALPPHATAVRSPPTSPSAALFSLFGHARSASQSSQPASPRSPMQLCSPPRSPSQMQFTTGPLSPSQLNIALGTASPFAQPSPPQTFVDFSHVVACTASPAGPSHAGSTSSCSTSPLYAAPVPLPPLPRPLAGRKPAKKGKRDDDGQRKKPLNSFTYYRKIFPELYPHINALIPTQKERSTITGAIWQAEAEWVKEECRKAVQVDRTPQKAERLEFVRQRMSTKRQQERAAAGTDRLQGRNLLIFQLWRDQKNKEEIERIVATWEDDAAATAEPKRKRRRVAKPPVPAPAPAPAPPVQFMQSPAAPEPLPFASPSPAFSLSTLPPTSSPAASTPAADFASPAPSMSSLPSYETFNPELPQQALDVSSSWPFLGLLAQDVPGLPMLQENDSQAYYVPTGEITEAAAHLNAADHTILPYIYGGAENLADLMSTYNYPEHYGPAPLGDLSGDEVGLTIELGSY